MFVPDGVVTNERISRLMDTSDEWIRQRTGIKERHYARRGTSSSDLGLEAARRAQAARSPRGKRRSGDGSPEFRALLKEDAGMLAPGRVPGRGEKLARFV